jgi:hypothetical protein
LELLSKWVLGLRALVESARQSRYAGVSGELARALHQSKGTQEGSSGEAMVTFNFGQVKEILEAESALRPAKDLVEAFVSAAAEDQILKEAGIGIVYNPDATIGGDWLWRAKAAAGLRPEEWPEFEAMIEVATPSKKVLGAVRSAFAQGIEPECEKVVEASGVVFFRVSGILAAVAFRRSRNEAAEQPTTDQSAYEGEDVFA